MAILRQLWLYFNCLLRKVTIQSVIPPKKPTKYEALCAHQSAIKRECLAGGNADAIHFGGAIVARLLSMYPTSPATEARTPITASNFAIGRTSSRAAIFARKPALAATARRTPRN